jgi:hypothetical protein
MKHVLPDTPMKPPLPAALKRRGLLLGGAAAAGAVALVAPRPAAGPVQAAGVAAPKPDDAEGGYRPSRHVLRYYETART